MWRTTPPEYTTYFAWMPSIKVRVVADRMLSDLMANALEAEGGIEIVDLGADVTVLDAAFCRTEWADGSEGFRRESSSALIVLAEDDDVGAAVAAARAGAVGWVAPGVSIGELVDLIRAVAEGGGAYPARHLGAVLRALRSDVEHASTSTTRLGALTDRELYVLRLLVEGLATREMATRLGLSVNTVRTHTHRIFRKLGVHHRLEAVRVARAAGLAPATTDD
jgi:DNA-binding NarL/FixJ family response regulator